MSRDHALPLPSGRGPAIARVAPRRLREAIRQDRGKTHRIDFEVADWKLWACVGPGDGGEPVLTIMLEGEG